MQTLVRDVVKCLLFLKKYGVVHCDLKPENILIKNENTMSVKVIDFGSANFIDCQDYDYLQTRPYRAPEVSFGCKFDFAADIWSLGCIIYELITSTVLFKYKTVQENYAKALSINNSLDFKMFADGKKWKQNFGQNGLLSIGAESSEKGIGKVVIPREGVDFKAELAEVCDSSELIDFVRRCLILDPIKRLRIEDAGDHSFLKNTIK